MKKYNGPSGRGCKHFFQPPESWMSDIRHFENCLPFSNPLATFSSLLAIPPSYWMLYEQEKCRDCTRLMITPSFSTLCFILGSKKNSWEITRVVNYFNAIAYGHFQKKKREKFSTQILSHFFVSEKTSPIPEIAEVATAHFRSRMGYLLTKSCSKIANVIEIRYTLKMIRCRIRNK